MILLVTLIVMAVFLGLVFLAMKFNMDGAAIADLGASVGFVFWGGLFLLIIVMSGMCN